MWLVQQGNSDCFLSGACYICQIPAICICSAKHTTPERFLLLLHDLDCREGFPGTSTEQKLFAMLQQVLQRVVMISLSLSRIFMFFSSPLSKIGTQIRSHRGYYSSKYFQETGNSFFARILDKGIDKSFFPQASEFFTNKSKLSEVASGISEFGFYELPKCWEHTVHKRGPRQRKAGVLLGNNSVIFWWSVY